MNAPKIENGWRLLVGLGLFWLAMGTLLMLLLCALAKMI